MAVRVLTNEEKKQKTKKKKTLPSCRSILFSISSPFFFNLKKDGFKQQKKPPHFLHILVQNFKKQSNNLIPQEDTRHFF